jgi:hypothetical protein
MEKMKLGVTYNLFDSEEVKCKTLYSPIIFFYFNTLLSSSAPTILHSLHSACSDLHLCGIPNNLKLWRKVRVVCIYEILLNLEKVFSISRGRVGFSRRQTVFDVLNISFI